MSSIRLSKGFTFGGWLPEILSQTESDDLNQISSVGIEDHDRKFMFQAFLAGMKNAAISSPNPSVGCVIVKNNKILATGCTDKWKGIHAERDAFSKVTDTDLIDATVYVTLEPCAHYGMQPPCIDLFKDKKIKKVVIARNDINSLVENKGINALKEIGIEVCVGLLSNEVTAWNYPFFIEKKFNRPMIALKWAQSLDGCLADDFDESKWISGPIARKYTHWLRQKYDAIMVGARTVLSDIPSLDVRHIQHKNKKNPFKIIFDPNCSIFFCEIKKQEMLREKTFQKNTRTLFLVDESMIKVILNDSSDWCVELRNSNEVKILSIAKQGEFYSAAEILHCLMQQEVNKFLQKPLQSILIEGGSYLLTLFAKEDFFDVAHTFISPFIIGGTKHKLFEKSQNRILSEIHRWQLIANECLDDDILMEMIPFKRQGEAIF